MSSVLNCTSCGMVGAKSRDHIIPKWFLRGFLCFGFTHYEVCRVAGFSIFDLIEPICVECNTAKSGVLDYRNKKVQRYMWAFMELVKHKIESLYEPRKLIAVCKCLECDPIVTPVTFDKVVEKENAISSFEAHKIMEEVKAIHDKGLDTFVADLKAA